MSIRQERKAKRASKKDRNGMTMDLSRPVRRSMQRLQHAINDYHATGGKNPQSDQAYTLPGSENYH